MDNDGAGGDDVYTMFGAAPLLLPSQEGPQGRVVLDHEGFTILRYSLVVFGVMGLEFENVKESWFLIMLFTDIPKVGGKFIKEHNFCR